MIHYYFSAMKTLLLVTLLLVWTSAAMAQGDKIGDFKFEKKQGSHAASVTFHSRAFDRSKHRVTRDRQSQTRVDGKLALGTDGNVPNIELDSVKLTFDGKEITIPRNLYVDCYEPNLDERDLSLRFSRDFQSLIVTMSGSDGAGGYEVVWRFRKDGHHSRSIKRGF